MHSDRAILAADRHPCECFAPTHNGKQPAVMAEAHPTTRLLRPRASEVADDWWGGEGRARDVVQPDLVADPHRLGVAAVLAADAPLQIGARLAPEADRHLHELADAALIDRGERILGENLLLQILHQEPGLGVVAGD